LSLLFYLSKLLSQTKQSDKHLEEISRTIVLHQRREAKMRENVGPVPRLLESKSGRGLEIEKFSHYVGKYHASFIFFFNKLLMIDESWGLN
jgi:hypothetical protein